MNRALTILITLFAFIACSDDNVDKSLLVGKWKYSKITAEVNTTDPKVTETITERFINDVELQGDIEFTVDGKYGYFDPIDERWYWGTYEFKKRDLQVCFFNGTECDIMIYSLQGERLIISNDETEWAKERYSNSKVTRAIQFIEYVK